MWQALMRYLFSPLPQHVKTNTYFWFVRNFHKVSDLKVFWMNLLMQNGSNFFSLINSSNQKVLVTYLKLMKCRNFPVWTNWIFFKYSEWITFCYPHPICHLINKVIKVRQLNSKDCPFSQVGSSFTLYCIYKHS